jgi:hypothetical protein
LSGGRSSVGGVPAIPKASANPSTTRPTGARLRALDGESPEARRFSPLNAPQRAVVEAFCGESRPWARRQARRTYGHLSTEMREQAIDRAMAQLRMGAPTGFDRRTLYTELSEQLTVALRQVHAGWCLNEAQGLWRREGPVVVPDEDDARTTAHALATFVEDGLGGLERAVLQLEIGAGRDTRTSRAALRLGPRQYERHREEGLSKLRSAIFGHASGRVCSQHLENVTLAATGDRAAQEALSSGEHRCRACAREAQGLRRVLQERLAIAPWPLAVKPAGIVAAKLGFVGAVFGGKAAGGGGFAAATAAPFGTGAGAVAGIIAAAAIATGTSAVIDGGDAPKTRPAAHAAAVAKPAAATTSSAGATTAAARPVRRAAAKAAPRHSATKKPAATHKPAASQPATTAPATGAAPQTASKPASTGTGTTNTPSVKDTVRDTVDSVRKTADPVTSKLPPVVQDPVDQTLDGAQGTVDKVTGAVDNLLP